MSAPKSAKLANAPKSERLGAAVTEPETTLLRYLPMSLLVLVMIAVPVMASQPEGVPRYRSLRHELKQLKDNNDKLRVEIADREREVQLLRTDLGTIEKIAREELGMVKQGEVVLQF